MIEASRKAMSQLALGCLRIHLRADVGECKRGPGSASECKVAETPRIRRICPVNVSDDDEHFILHNLDGHKHTLGLAWAYSSERCALSCMSSNGSGKRPGVC